MLITIIIAVLATVPFIQYFIIINFPDVERARYHLPGVTVDSYNSLQKMDGTQGTTEKITMHVYSKLVSNCYI